MTLKTLLNRGLVANDGNGDTPRAGALKINALVSSTYVATQAQFGGATKEATITNTIAAAKADGAKYVRIPQIYDLDGSNMLPYDASLVTFNTAVRMVREGGDPSAYDALAYGAYPDGVTDNTAAFAALWLAATAGVTVDSTPGHVTGAARIRIPSGKYAAVTFPTLASSGVTIIGDGSGATTIIPLSGTTGITIDGGASAYLRHVGVRGISIDYSTVTVQPSAIGLSIKKCTDTCALTDVQVVFPQANTVSSLTGISFVDCESWSLRDVWIGWLRGTGSVGILFDNNGINRGNMVLTNVLVRDAYIGWKNIGSNVTNGLVFNSFKVVNSAAGAAVAPLYGIWIAGQTYGATFNDPHIESVSGGSFNFTTGIFLDATGTAIRNVKINNAMIERATTGIDLGSAGGTVQHCRVADVRFLSTETITNGVVLGSSATDNWVLGLTAQPTVTNWLVDNSAANSGNLFQWNLGGGSAGKPLYYKGAMSLQDGAAAPGTYTGIAGLFVDVAEGPLKVKSGTGVSRALSQTQFADTNKTTTSSSDGSITSYSLPAGILATNGQAVRITARGRQSTQPGSFNVKFGATTIATITPATGDNWTFEATVVRVSATTQTANTLMVSNATASNASAFPGETLANAITVDFRGSVTAGGTLRLDYCSVVVV